MSEPAIETVRLASSDVEVVLTNVGAAMISVEAADRNGHRENVCLSLGQAAAYQDNPSNFGAVVGRFANRIGGAAFELDGVAYRLEANNGPNNLHSGSSNVAARVWEIAERTEASVRFAVVSNNGDGGFPGAVSIEATYRLQDDTLVLTYAATTDAPTVVNLTNHAYWNLAGAAPGCDVRDHVVQLHADRVLEVDANVLPTGAIEEVAGTPFDLREPTRLADV